MRALSALLGAITGVFNQVIPGRVGKFIALIALAAALAWIMYAASSVKLARWS